jgi:hypothetical protein
MLEFNYKFFDFTLKCISCLLFVKIICVSVWHRTRLDNKRAEANKLNLAYQGSIHLFCVHQGQTCIMARSVQSVLQCTVVIMPWIMFLEMPWKMWMDHGVVLFLAKSIEISGKRQATRQTCISHLYWNHCCGAASFLCGFGSWGKILMRLRLWLLPYNIAIKFSTYAYKKTTQLFSFWHF